jgi:hypothetical protein
VAGLLELQALLGQIGKQPGGLLGSPQVGATEQFLGGLLTPEYLRPRTHNLDYLVTSPPGKVKAVENDPLGSSAFGAIDLATSLPTGGATAIFAGPLAKTANKAMLQRAEQMAAQGAERTAIWNETGWFKGGDGKWRFEIPDDTARLTPKAADELMASDGGAFGASQRSAPGLLQHDALYAAYPEMRPISVDARHNVNLSPRSVEGEYIAGRPDAGWRPHIRVSSNSLEGDANSVRGLTLHEMQHDVQGREGFAAGGGLTGHKQEDIWKAAKSAYEDSAGDAALLRELGVNVPDAPPQLPWDQLSRREQVKWLERGRERLYTRLGGEVEARNVQSRMNMTPEQRRAMPPWTTEY